MRRLVCASAETSETITYRTLAIAENSSRRIARRGLRARMCVSSRAETRQMVGSNIEIRPNAVYTLAEVCQILRISDATARRWLKAGKLRAARVGRAYRVLGSQLLDALNQERQERESSRLAS